MSNNRTSIPCLFNTSNFSGNASLLPVDLVLMHDNDNRNQSHISLETIQRYADSIKNKPILAYLKKDENGEYDFGGHEIEFEWNEAKNDYSLRYLEFPVGIIPESTEISYFSKNGKTYLKCTGYVYREYSNETIELIKKTNGKCVSVELDVNDIDFIEDGLVDIKSFEFLGVTILSDSITPGMDETCRISFMKDTVNERFRNNYSEFIDKANKDILDLEEVETDEDNVEFTTGESEQNLPDEDIEPKEVEEVNGTSAVVEEVTETVDEKNDETADEEVIEETIDENSAEKEQFDYSLFNELFGVEFNSPKELFEMFVNKLNEKQTALDELIKFKEEYDDNLLKEAIDEIIEKFNLSEDEVEQYREKAYKKEITTLELENQLYIQVGKNALNLKFSKPNKVREIPLFEKDDKNTSKIYGGILDKYKITEVL